ncbi:hypothetical protein GIB67_028342 [Kingdonia uniflora]|uniref:NOT2/NOT3/NOT5 C-terminal domain-containing protein n=1 Tax=Kingdonia uniflora TaxID=39325 RepID=A0A7J7MI34_9MAGN|nr:hypothetical protein GIB67_028342 [Kingdonia uniflora]
MKYGSSSALNDPSSNLQDTSGRSFATSFTTQSASAAPGFHHAGSMQVLHSMHGSFNVPSMQGNLTSRNTTMNGAPSSTLQQPAGSFSSGRFASNNIPIPLSQISHGSSHGHSVITNRGVGLSPGLANAGPRITSSMGNIIGGGNMGRTLNSGGALSVPGLGSRLNLAGNSGSGSLGLQGSNRLIGGVLPQGPQMMSMLGNSYSAAGGPLSQSQVQAGNNSLSSMGMLNDVSSNENSPFDMNEFPRLSGRPGSAGGHQGQLGSLRKQGVSPIVQQNQEFSIQNEDFPALPGFKGGSTDFAMDLHQKEQLHENAMSMMQSQHFPMGRSSGFSLGGTHSTHRQQQQQHAPSVSSGGGSFANTNSQDLFHLHSSDLLPSSHTNYHSQGNGQPSIGFRSGNNPNPVSGIMSYDQIIQQYSVQDQSRLRLQQMSLNQSLRDQNMKSLQATQATSDRFGLLGLLSVIRMSDPDLTPLALGIDLTTLGLNLNSNDDLHQKFSSPWSDEPAKGEPQYSVPECYYAQHPPVLHRGHFSKFPLETLFYIFYSMPKDEAQLFAANELYTRGWLYHKELQTWLIPVANVEPLVKTSTYERGSYHCFDPKTWDPVRKDNFVLIYDLVEKRPALSLH